MFDLDETSRIVGMLHAKAQCKTGTAQNDKVLMNFLTPVDIFLVRFFALTNQNGKSGSEINVARI